MNVPTADSLDRFLELSARIHVRAASLTERDEWRGLLHTLVEGEIGARARLHPEEGRRHLRTAVRLPARVSGPAGLSASVNVSLGTGGLKIHSSLPVSVGDSLAMVLSLPDRTILAQARVVWHHPENLGVELVDLAETDRHAIEGAVVEAMLQLK